MLGLQARKPRPEGPGAAAEVDSVASPTKAAAKVGRAARAAPATASPAKAAPAAPAAPAAAAAAAPLPVDPSSLRLPEGSRCLLTLAARALHAGRLPPSPTLPCRETEQREIEAFLHGALASGAPGSLYVSGSPGVGKTAVMSRILSSLPGWCAARGVPRPVVHSVNGLTADWGAGDLHALLDSVLKGVKAGVSSRSGGNIATLGGRGGDDGGDDDEEEDGDDGSVAGPPRVVRAAAGVAASSAAAEDDDDDADYGASSDDDADGGGARKRQRASSAGASRSSAASAAGHTPSRGRAGGSSSTASSAPFGGSLARVSPAPPPSSARAPPSAALAALAAGKGITAALAAASASVSGSGGGSKKLLAANLKALSNTKWAKAGQQLSITTFATAGGSPAASPLAGAKRSASSAAASPAASDAAPSRKSSVVGFGAAGVASASPAGTPSRGAPSSPAHAAARTPPKATPAPSPTASSSSSARSGGKPAAFSASSSPLRPMHVVVIDELDGLLQRGDKAQAALLRLFQEPARAGSRVVVVGIANAVAMTEKFLPVLRRVGAAPAVAVFRPYSDGQICEIVANRLRGACDAFEAARRTAMEQAAAAAAAVGKRGGASRGAGSVAASSTATAATATAGAPPLLQQQPQCVLEPLAISYLSKKVSLKTGDLRRALDIARKAVLAACHEWCDPPPELPPPAPAVSLTSEEDDEAAAAAAAAAALDDAPLLDAPDAAADSSAAADDVVMDGGSAATAASLEDVASSTSSAASAVAAAPSPPGTPARSGATKSSSPSPATPVAGDGALRPLCRCCLGGPLWQNPPVLPAASAASAADTSGGVPAGAAAASSSAASSSAAAAATVPPPPLPPRKPQPFAVTLRELRPLLEATDRRYTPALQALPRQGLLLVCAARALAEKAAKEEAAKREARDGRLSAHVVSNLEGASALTDAARARKKAEEKEPAAGGAAIPVRVLEASYGRICRKRLQLGGVGRGPAASSSVTDEFGDLLNRLVDDGILARQTRAGGRGGFGPGGGLGGVGGPGGGAGASVASSSACWVRVNVELADLDFALGDSLLYRSLAAEVRAGTL